MPSELDFVSYASGDSDAPECAAVADHQRGRGPAPPSLAELRALPKVELHAHLSGSIKQEFLLQLMQERGQDTSGSGLPFDCMRDLDKAVDNCWVYFAKVAQLVTDLRTLRRCALHVLEAFAAENCVYLELRTSPKEFVLASDSPAGAARKTSKRDYMRTIVEAIQEFREAAPSPGAAAMEVRLLVSVDRGAARSVEDARRIVNDVADLCLEFSEHCVGVDICGLPTKMTLEPFVFPALFELRDARPGFFEQFPITCHTAETPAQERENDLVVASLERLNIRRLGHVLFLTAAQRQAVMDRAASPRFGRIGIELCPTSNMVLRQDHDMRRHHFPLWYRPACRRGADAARGAAAATERAPAEAIAAAPAVAPAAAPEDGPKARKRGHAEAFCDDSGGVLVSVNTDDIGLFRTSLSKELHLIAHAFELDLQAMRQLQLDALESSFLRDKDFVRTRLFE